MDEPQADTATDDPPTQGTSRSVGSRLLRLSGATLMGMVALCAITMIVMLVGAWGYTQLGPGGLLSEVQVGKPAPDFELAMIDGSLMRLSDYRGQPVALNFWTTWCPGCGAELPRLEKTMEEHADEGLVVLAVNGGEWPANVESFLEERGVELDVPLDAKKEVYNHYNIKGLPTTIWIDRDGIVRAVHIGVLSDEELDRYASDLIARGATP